MTDTTAPAVQLTDITKRFGDVVANDSVDLTLDRGSIHAVIGENGAGKTTLMNVLYGLYDPNEGTMAVDGEPRSFDSPRDAIAAGIGMIHQHFQLVDNMTVLQNIVLGHEPSTRGLVDEQAARRRITDICDTYGFSVDEHLDTPIEELGLGIQQHVGAAVAWLLAGDGSITQAHLWVAFVAVAVVSGVLATLFAVLLIRYEANQIVAGLAVWFIGLGFGPFAATVLWGGVSSPSLPNIDTIAVPVLAEIPVLGRLFFDASPLVLLTIVVAVAAWAVLFRTRYGYWVQAAGENPEALDTAGIDVNRVRYATVVFSGVMAGLGGAVLSIGIGSGFTGTGVTMVDGRGWIAIVAYLFGNYNPLGTYGASLLFGAMDMLQIQLQTIGISLPGSITGLFPYVAVLVVLVGVGYTRVPSAVGESYDTEE